MDVRRNGHDDLSVWLADLRQRLARGDLASLTPLDLGDGLLATGELTVRIMLADLDHLDDLIVEAPDGSHLIDRRQRLLSNFRRLREMIG